MSEMENDTVTLVIEDNPIVVSKSELMKESEFFEVMFTKNFAEKNKQIIPMKEVSAKEFLGTLEIARKKEQEIDCTNALELLAIIRVANKYLFTNVQSKCVEAIGNMLTADNVLEIWQAAEELNLNELFLKIRYIAATEFETIRKTANFLKLNSAMLYRFLASIALLCDNEMNVFEAAMLWLINNQEESVDKEDTIYKLLICLDFNQLTVTDLMEIQKNKFIKNSKDLSAVLQYIIDNKSEKTSFEHASDVIDKANILLKSKARIKDGYPTILHLRIRSPDAEIQPEDLPLVLFYYDGSHLEVIEPGDTYRADFHSAYGQGVFTYKQRIFYCGGELRIGSEKWVKKLYAYDIIKGKFEAISNMPFMRRHFQVVVCGCIAYLIGGYGRYRKNQSQKMFYYNCETGTWSRQILLPQCKKDEILCCSFNQQLLLVVASEKKPKAFLFSEQTGKWQNLTIIINGKIGIEHVITKLFSYNGKVFMKGPYLTEFKLENNLLIQTNTTKIEILKNSLILDCCVCNNKVYSSYEAMFEGRDHLIEIYCLESHTITYVPLDFRAQHIFPFRHYDICKTEEYVNEYFKVDV